jgi:hypothetical protein
MRPGSPSARARPGNRHGYGNVGSYVRRNGLPPAMAAKRERPATPEEIEAMFAKPVMRERPPNGPGHSTP